MLDIIISFSRYIFIGFMFIFIYYNFRAFNMDIRKKLYSHIYRKQRSIILMTHFLGMSIIVLSKLADFDIRYVFLYLQQLIFIVVFLFFYNRIFKNASKLLMNNVIYLITISFITLTRISYSFGRNQLFGCVLAASLIFIIPYIMKQKKIVIRLERTYAVIGFLLLLYVFFFGKESGGAKNWIIIGGEESGLSFQPSEIVKILYIFYIASLFKEEQTLKRVIEGTFVAGVYVLMLVAKTDLGMGLIFAVIYMVMLVIATSNWLYFFAGILGGSAASVVAYNLFTHVKNRVILWKDPWTEYHTRFGAEQIVQGLLAIATGGWLGLGVTKGSPSLIRVSESDYIIAVIAEEFGSLFVIGMLIIMLCIFITAFNIAKDSEYSFYALVAAGISCAYAFQIFLIVGGVFKLIPLTGVTIPFVSAGNSSLLSSFLMLGVLQSLFIIRDNDAQEDLGDMYEEK